MNNLYELLYCPLTNILEKIKQQTEESADQYQDDDAIHFLDQKIDTLDSAIEEFRKLESGQAIESNSREIVDTLLSTQTFDFNESHWTFFKKIATLTVFVENDESFDPSDELDLIFDDFELKSLDIKVFPFSFFSYLNNQKVKNSAIYIDLDFDVEPIDFETEFLELNEELSNSNLTPQALAWLTYKLHLHEGIDQQSRYILFHPEILAEGAELENIVAALRVQAVLQNRVIHSSKDAQKPVLDSRFFQRLTPSHPYQQFNELLMILSEYNESNDVIKAFLCLYHVLESFMVKVPIANLAKENSGHIFSIRDFRRLYTSIDNSEAKAIEGLFNQSLGKFWERPILDRKFKEIVEAQRKQFTDNLDATSEAQVENFLKRLNCKPFPTYQKLKQENSFSPENYAKFVYSVRCAVVHNKETEHHISYFNLDQPVSDCFNSVLINPLVNLYADLLTDQTSPIWYHGPSIKLY